MKIIDILASILLIGYITCNCNSITDYSVDNCKNAKTGDGYCCYYEAPKRTRGSKGCIPLSKYEYDNIKTLAKYYKTFGGDNGDTEDKKAKIDCKSFYLQISLIILILLFL